MTSGNLYPALPSTGRMQTSHRNSVIRIPRSFATAAIASTNSGGRSKANRCIFELPLTAESPKAFHSRWHSSSHQSFHPGIHPRAESFAKVRIEQPSAWPSTAAPHPVAGIFDLDEMRLMVDQLIPRQIEVRTMPNSSKFALAFIVAVIFWVTCGGALLRAFF